MSRAFRSVCVLPLLLGLACASTPAPAPEAPPAAPEAPPVALAPAPFPADAIRAATRPGRTYVFKVVEGPAEPVLRHMVFTEVTEAGGVIEASVHTPSGEVLAPPSAEPFTWAELESHAHFPAAATTITDAQLDTPLGPKACRLYTVEQEEDNIPMVVSYWFAVDLPGAPVRVEARAGGELVMTMEVVEHKAGG